MNDMRLDRRFRRIFVAATLAATVLAAGLGLRAVFAAPPRNGEPTAQELARRLDEIRAMSIEEKQDLLRRWERFRRLPREEQQRIRSLHAEINADAEATRLVAVLDAYQDWLGRRSAAERDELRGLEDDARVAAIKAIHEAEFGYNHADALVMLNWAKEWIGDPKRRTAVVRMDVFGHRYIRPIMERRAPEDPITDFESEAREFGSQVSAEVVQRSTTEVVYTWLNVSHFWEREETYRRGRPGGGRGGPPRRGDQHDDRDDEPRGRRGGPRDENRRDDRERDDHKDGNRDFGEGRRGPPRGFRDRDRWQERMKSIHEFSKELEYLNPWEQKELLLPDRDDYGKLLDAEDSPLSSLARGQLAKEDSDIARLIVVRDWLFALRREAFEFQRELKAGRVDADALEVIFAGLETAEKTRLLSLPREELLQELEQLQADVLFESWGEFDETEGRGFGGPDGPPPGPPRGGPDGERRGGRRPGPEDRR